MDAIVQEVAALRAMVRAQRDVLRADYEAHGDAPSLLQTRCRQADEILIRL